mmetsp:Transcript_58663/g.187030  ORF Transcript_58663/g.187030 Transcript_58663/m.187030 type:complete len:131 (-) Transcript_58663:224-616(-)
MRDFGDPFWEGGGDFGDPPILIGRELVQGERSNDQWCSPCDISGALDALSTLAGECDEREATEARARAPAGADARTADACIVLGARRMPTAGGGGEGGGSEEMLFETEFIPSDLRGVVKKPPTPTCPKSL